MWSWRWGRPGGAGLARGKRTSVQLQGVLLKEAQAPFWGGPPAFPGQAGVGALCLCYMM